MRPRPQSEPEAPAPVDRARVRELVSELHAAKCGGESIHATAPIYALDDICGSCMAGYYVAGMLGHPDGPRPIEPIVDHLMKCAAKWAEAAADH